MNLAPLCIETERLILRQVTPDLYNQAFETYTKEELKAFFGYNTEEELAVETLKHKEGMTSYNKSFLLFQLIKKGSVSPLGSCGYHTWYIRHSRAEIGYSIHIEEEKRQGYMKEALPFIIRYGFDYMRLNRIEAFVGPANIPSVKLVKSLGFTEEGRMREHYFKNDRIEDSIIFSLLKREYTGYRQPANEQTS